MRIAIVSSGNSIHVKKIANYLVENGNDVTLITLKNHKNLLNEFNSKINIKILPFKSPYGYYLNALFLRNIIKKGNYDIVNSHYASGYGTLVRLANCHPLVLAVFGSDVYEYPYKSDRKMNLIIKNLQNADTITSTSNIMAEEVKKFYNKKEIYVTPFGVDINMFNQSKRSEKDIFIFGTIKKIEYKYGIDILIKSYAEFRKKFTKCKTKLVIYGRGSATADLKKLSNELGISKFVEFKGFIPNEQVPKALSEMDVACFPSRSESFGVAAVEAMACGIPVIASNASGFTEVIDNNKTGILVQKEDVNALYEAMKKIYLMPQNDRNSMGNNGIERVRKLYNFENNMENYAEILQHTIK